MNNLEKITNGQKNFFCYSCQSKTQHNWDEQVWSNYLNDRFDFQPVVCESCDANSIWIGDKMIYPKHISVPLPHVDMPKPVKEIYNEARLVSVDSKRAAAALLRVALEDLTIFLGETEGKLNARIGNLKKKGLPEKVIQGLDTVRIYANEGGSHSGEIDLSGEDNAKVVQHLFWLVNYIIEKTITENEQIEKHFGNLPIEKLDGIKNRDSN
jgi:hypothetical protein